MPVSAEPMRHRPRRRRWLVVLGGMIWVAAVFFYGCSLDFTVRPDPGDSGDATDTGSESSPVDSAAADGDAGAITDGPKPDATLCASLANDLPPKRSKARECAFQVGECQAIVKDECGCDVVVSFADAGRTSDYEAALKAFLNAGCKATCNACKTNPNKNCLSGANGTFCYEP